MSEKRKKKQSKNEGENKNQTKPTKRNQTKKREQLVELRALHEIIIDNPLGVKYSWEQKIDDVFDNFTPAYEPLENLEEFVKLENERKIAAEAQKRVEDEKTVRFAVNSHTGNY